MKDILDMDEMEVGFDIPAKVGMDEADIQTPCLVLDLDALERNIVKMGDYARDHGMRHRIHGKMHKSVDVALLQEKLGGAVGVCCQKVSEAEVFARGGIKDVLVSNQVREPAKIDRWRELPKYGSCRPSFLRRRMSRYGARLFRCAAKKPRSVSCFVEIGRWGSGPCGVYRHPRRCGESQGQSTRGQPSLSSESGATSWPMQHIDSFTRTLGARPSRGSRLVDIGGDAT